MSTPVKYLDGDIFVEAVEFDPADTCWPKGVERWDRGKAPRDMSWGHVGSTHVWAGDFIVTYPDGGVVPFRPADFFQIFIPVTLLAAMPQPAPVQGRQDVGAFVLADIQARIEAGKEKYGTLLQTGNGRDALWDAYQEAIDLCMYLRQAILEREETDGALAKARIGE